ncbi:MAG: hypothetical protein RHS_0159 [Robinsoniella sp. RHS]|uniref:sugar ABC transporter substrate-binding protein n=1 Tax=Robinsoniella TaxID=588605 RepID=UPI000649C50A|nr:MAG: hypothetical protein RHS_0159 [Robinsoniella sp. RHS]
MKKMLKMGITLVMAVSFLTGCGSGTQTADGSETVKETIADTKKTEAAADAEKTGNTEKTADAEKADTDTAQAGDKASGTEKASGESGNKDIKLGFVCMNLGNPWFVEVKKGFEDACKELGVTGMVVDSQYDVDKQVSDLESLINDNYNGIMISPIDQNATSALIDKTKEKNIAVSCVAQSQDNADMRYIVNEYEYGSIIGENAANWINENLKDLDKVKVAIISQDNVEAVIPRGDGVQETLEKMCPNVEIVSRQPGDTPEAGMKIIEGVLQQTPDLNVVAAVNDSGGIGGYQALSAAGFTGDDPVAVFSGDATDEALNAMKEEDTIYRGTVDLYPYRAGFESAKKLFEYVQNGRPAEQEDIFLKPVAVPLKDLLDGTYKK